MKILLVCSGNKENFDFSKDQAFINDQVEAVKLLEREIIIRTFFVKRKGIKGYLRSLPGLKQEIKLFKPDIIHAHGGLIALLTNFQRKIPVIVTFHGSDININKVKWISAMATFLSHISIYVSQKLHQKSLVKKKSDVVIPCGINLTTFKPVELTTARQALGLPAHEPYILFCSQFDNPVKNFDLAGKALKLIPAIKVMEIVNRTREEVNLLINGASLVLLTSFSEGSPNIIKEAMACNCPIVSVDVGDVKEVLGNTEGCYITSYDPANVAEKIKLALAFGRRTKGREKMGHLESSIIAGKILEAYKSVLTPAE